MVNLGQTAKRKKMDLVYQVIKRHPNGIKEQEIADDLNMSNKRRTINNYLRELEIEGKIYKEENSTLWFALPYESVKLRGIELSPEEAMTLYLAVRLLVKQHDKRNDAAQLALTNLAEVLTGDAKVGHEIYQAALELAHRPGDEKYARIFRTMMQAYIYRRKVAISYKPLNKDSFDTIFSPYLFEPSAIGFATYVIGHSSKVNDRRTYKLQRIQSAALTRDEYDIPPDFPGLEILRNAWSIIHSDTLIPVKLRFSPNVAERVRESQWHPSQEPVKDDPDNPGWIIWKAQVADLTDLKPWVRSWGADVEVLQPEGLRKSLERETKLMAQQYGITTPTKESPEARLLRCWGKTGKTVEDFHPALYHMFDVGHVAEQLLHPAAPSRWRRVLARAFNTDPQTLIHWLPWFIALHDIGKVSVPFQTLNADQKARLEKEGFAFGRWRPKYKQHHTITGQIFLKKEFADLTQLPRPLRAAWLEMLGGHHGEFAESRMKNEGFENLRHATSFLKEIVQEPEIWSELRIKAGQILQNHFLRQTLNTLPEPANVSAAIMALTGFTILCDWLGSDEKYFSSQADTDLLDYIAISRQRARHAVEDAGLMYISRSTAPQNFEALFPARVPARPLQLAIDAIPTHILEQPILAIIEAPTGEGKTEAALALAHRLAQHTDDDEFYCALPTTATSNQMYLRIQQYLAENLGLATGVNLVHGQAFLVKHDLEFNPMGDVETSEAPAWFSPKKKALLSPFAVGTVDQAELAALNVKHNALRLIGLAGKVVILDEVHAYDTYMTTIIEQMLRWLSALGSSVILLSATLPLSRRKVLMEAYGVTVDDKTGQSNAYPALWVGGEADVYTCSPPAYQHQRNFALKPLHLPHDDAEQKAQWLLAQIAAGGNACWICNTVARAQKLAQAIQKADTTVECHLLHSMFPLNSRSRLEEKIRNKYGPDGERPERSIVIGTQVLEQSLDLDFDVMVSDLAPIDLLLQRMGRLHRHKNQRPNPHKNPVLWVNCELNPEAPSLLKMGADKFYTEYILQRTWQAISNRNTITLPADYRPLVETVYTPQPPAEDDVLFDAWHKLQKKEANAELTAKQRLLDKPNPDRPFCHNNQTTFVEDEDSAAWIVAQTRLGAESVTVIPLEKDGNTAHAIPTGLQISLFAPSDRKTALKLLHHSIRISRSAIVDHFKHGDLSQETLFKETSLLKNVYPLWLKPHVEEGVFIADDLPVPVSLHPELGLVIGEILE